MSFPEEVVADREGESAGGEAFGGACAFWAGAAACTDVLCPPLGLELFCATAPSEARSSVAVRNTTALVMHASELLVIANLSRCSSLIYPVIGVTRAEDSGKGTKEVCRNVTMLRPLRHPLVFPRLALAQCRSGVQTRGRRMPRQPLDLE